MSGFTPQALLVPGLPGSNVSNMICSSRTLAKYQLPEVRQFVVCTEGTTFYPVRGGMYATKVPKSRSLPHQRDLCIRSVAMWTMTQRERKKKNPQKLANIAKSYGGAGALPHPHLATLVTIRAPCNSPGDSDKNFASTFFPPKCIVRTVRKHGSCLLQGAHFDNDSVDLHQPQRNLAATHFGP